MLKLSGITKVYEAGDLSVTALKNVSIEFRKNEFVSILGQSGCGKTTLLNIIGGLDRYTSGDLVISGRSTKEYKDHDWDTYRNHSIGFVFQSYNLIPHQTVLNNVELALTLSGVSKAERRKRAVEALEKVGLGNQLNKKPNQMSGGQMQRVAIARALINNPEILLADEPTGALDSETSEQIMELLKEVANDRLVIMVTHNPELAEKYSTRIIKLLDGEIIGDSNPYNSALEETTTSEETDGGTKDKKKKSKREKGTSMSFITALSLSLNNLLTKKGRTFMTAFAGSIGIIGIALILSLSSGFQAYIDSVQEDTLSSYPITIEAEQVDMSKLMQSFLGNSAEDKNREDGKIYANTDMYDMMNAYMNPEVNHNNLKKLMAWIESSDSKVKDYATAIQYGYASPLETYYYDLSAGIIPTNDYAALFDGLFSGTTQEMATTMTGGSAIKVFEELLESEKGNDINELIFSQYELIDDDMRWPENKNEVVLIVDKNNEIAETYLYTLGILDRSKIEDLMIGMTNGDDTGKDVYATTEWDYSDFVGMKFRLVLPTDKYVGTDTDGDGKNDRWEDKQKDENYMKLMLGSAEELEIVGIIRPREDAVSASLTGAIGYRSELTDWYLEEIKNSEIVKYQQEHPETDVLTGLPFKVAGMLEPTAAEKAAELKEWAATATEAEKAAAYLIVASTPDEVTLQTNLAETMKNYPDRASREAFMLSVYLEQSDMDETTIKNFISKMTDEEVENMTREIVSAGIMQTYAANVSQQLAPLPEVQKAAMFDAMLNTSDEVTLANAHDLCIPSKYSESSLKNNLSAFGYAEIDNPATINIYAATFEDKDKIADLIEEYNKSVSEEDKISYTDYVALMMSSVSTIINVISYVLIAFVSISLVVSSIMIGIITYISVLERTKEIGILRSIGASKRDISRVFNAETLIVGFVAGMIGILVTVLLNIPINIVIEALGDIKNVAFLPVGGAIILVVISMVLTFIAGLVPSRVAANKDPVVALRTE